MHQLRKYGHGKRECHNSAHVRRETNLGPESARATTATSPLFSPFKKPETGHEYANGGIRSMCPITIAHYEAKSIWEDIANTPPDLVLSVGTGRNIGDRSKAELTSPASLHASTNESLAPAQLRSAVIRQGRGGMGNYKLQNPSGSTASDHLGKKSPLSGYIVRNPQTPMLLSFNNPLSGQTDRLNDQRLCEKTWNRFLSSHVARKPSILQRYRRISPDLFSKLPRFDDVSKIDELEREAQEVLRQDSAELIEVAHRLVASTFFFEKDITSIKQKASGFTCTGTPVPPSLRIFISARTIQRVSFKTTTPLLLLLTVL
jgi:hypothetical protein